MIGSRCDTACSSLYPSVSTSARIPFDRSVDVYRLFPPASKKTIVNCDIVPAVYGPGAYVPTPFTCVLVKSSSPATILKL